MFKLLAVKALGLTAAGAIALGTVGGVLAGGPAPGGGQDTPPGAGTTTVHVHAPHDLPPRGGPSVQPGDPLVQLPAHQPGADDGARGSSHQPSGTADPGGHGNSNNTDADHGANSGGHDADNGKGGHHDADNDADGGAGQRPHNHGFFVSQVARGATTTVPGVTIPSNPQHHGQAVQAVAKSNAGKSHGKTK